MRKTVDRTQQKTVTLANPVRNAASAPVAWKSRVKLSNGSGSPLAHFLPPQSRLVAPAEILGQFVEPHRHRDEQGLASEKGQRSRASFSSGFLPQNPLREAT
jgi:hypothetical protein